MIVCRKIHAASALHIFIYTAEGGANVARKLINSSNKELINSLFDESPSKKLIDQAREVHKGFNESWELHQRLKKEFKQDQDIIRNILNEITKKMNVIDRYGQEFKKLEYTYKRLLNCGNYKEFNDYFTIAEFKLTKASFCGIHLLCLLCSKLRREKSLKKYLEKYKIIKEKCPELKLSTMTLTVKSGEDLAERFNHFKDCLETVKDLRRRTRSGQHGYNSEFGKIAGYVGFIEFTKNDKDWHVHAHLLVLHEDTFNYKALQTAWKKISKDSCYVYVEKCQNPDEPEQDFIKLFRYAGKYSKNYSTIIQDQESSDLTPEQAIEVYLVMSGDKDKHGERLLISAGVFRGIKLPEPQHDKELENLPHINLHYGKSLEDSEPKLVKRVGSDGHEDESLDSMKTIKTTWDAS